METQIALSGTETRLLIVGGAGSLYVNKEHTACVSDGPDFPDIFKPLAKAMAKALSEIRQRNVKLSNLVSAIHKKVLTISNLLRIIISNGLPIIILKEI